MGIGDAPKPKTLSISKAEAIAQLANEKLLEDYQFLFTFIEREDAALAAELKSDYDEFMDTLREIMKQNPSHHTLGDIKKIIPNNQWLQLVEDMEDDRWYLTKNIPDAKDALKKRMKGTDIN